MSRNGRLRVLVLTAEEGEGHFRAAGALAAELSAEAGGEVVVRDAYKGDFGRLIPFFSRDAYHFQVRWLPWSYWLEYVLFAKFPPLRALARGGLALFGARPLLRLVRRIDPDLVVSTHPALTSTLGYLRRRGRLELPVVATITDLLAHPLWAHRGVDLHLVMHESCLRAVERVAGRDSARVVRPIVAPAFRAPSARAEARAALELPPDEPVVVVTGGGWAVGDIEGAVRSALRVPGSIVICLSGRQERVRARLALTFADEPRVRVLAFSERMPELLAAADALVDSSVGVTCLEALACGCPIVVHGAPLGHSRDNAKAIARLGLAQLARSPEQLTAALARALNGGVRPELRRSPSAASLIAAARLRDQPRPVWRRRLTVATAALSGTLALAGWTFASTVPYPIIASTFDLHGLSVVKTERPLVGLVLATPERETRQLAVLLARRHVQASFADTATPSAQTLDALERLGDEALPMLKSEQPTRLLSARQRLLREARRLQLRGHFYFLAPHHFSLAEYIATRSIGGRPVEGAIRLRAAQLAPMDDELRAGAIVVVSVDPPSPAALERVVSQLLRRGLQPVSLSEQLASARSSPDPGPT